VNKLHIKNVHGKLNNQTKVSVTSYVFACLSTKGCELTRMFEISVTFTV